MENEEKKAEEQPVQEKSGKQVLMELDWNIRSYALFFLGPLVAVASLAAALAGEVKPEEGIAFAILGGFLFLIGWGMRRQK